MKLQVLPRVIRLIGMRREAYARAKQLHHDFAIDKILGTTETDETDFRERGDVFILTRRSPKSRPYSGTVVSLGVGEAALPARQTRCSAFEEDRVLQRL